MIKIKIILQRYSNCTILIIKDLPCLFHMHIEIIVKKLVDTTWQHDVKQFVLMQRKKKSRFILLDFMHIGGSRKQFQYPMNKASFHGMAVPFFFFYLLSELIHIYKYKQKTKKQYIYLHLCVYLYIFRLDDITEPNFAY